LLPAKLPANGRAIGGKLHQRGQALQHSAGCEESRKRGNSPHRNVAKERNRARNAPAATERGQGSAAASNASFAEQTGYTHLPKPVCFCGLARQLQRK
jgi:hypothetical protein